MLAVEILVTLTFWSLVLSFQMYEDGYKTITNIDLSGNAIEKMKKQQEEKGHDMICIVYSF